ncbi:MAG: J domain-containing protein [Anaerotruncus sp.]|nr:J domain-containing protein [Anaerotruncus sp.]
MTDPYKVLGISPNATDDQVKAAYRELAKKYHPDNYAGNPLSDLAEEKMQEINQAYDAIVSQRRNSRGASSGYTSGHQQSAAGTSQFADIRRLINSGRIAEAQELLDGVAMGSRDAEWYFLRGSIYYSRGWLDDALKNFQQACAMNPQNQEYAAAYNQLVWQRQNGRSQFGGHAGVNSCSCCDICAAIYCANCCMDCGGCF